ncbi:hypothetical protein LPJ66_001235 [Kickxella alabastrina]|uniref:Uncharacterized protein n=1 Tax=Kickxella alabastrina TaxID=61397 RepID=A0ACC1ITX1_9FUNG|nr:hypothetical protein LPJ66_001235 [Kickxella alabastrina]
MQSLFRRSQAIRADHGRQRPTWEERARAALATAREVEESSGESVPTRPSEVNASKRLCYGPRYILPGTHDGLNELKIQQQHEEPCDVLQSNFSLDASSLHISSLMVENADSPSAVTQSPFYTLIFTVNSLVPLTVNLHWLATEEWNTEGTAESGYPRFVSRVSINRSYALDAGRSQRFALPKSDWLVPNEEPYCTLLSPDWQARNGAVSTAVTFNAADSTLIVANYSQPFCEGGIEESGGGSNIELDVLQPRDPRFVKDVNEIQEVSSTSCQKAPAYGLIIELIERCPDQQSPTQSIAPASQISFIEFYNEGGMMVIPRCIKQKVCVGGMLYLQHEIFGLRETMASHASLRNDESPQCAICLSDDRDTVLLPCRHMCMCRECANTYRQQSNKCPICRTVVDTILHIQSNEQDQPLVE